MSESTKLATADQSAPNWDGSALEPGFELLTLDTSDVDSTVVLPGNRLTALLDSKQALPSEPPKGYLLDEPEPQETAAQAMLTEQQEDPTPEAPEPQEAATQAMLTEQQEAPAPEASKPQEAATQATLSEQIEDPATELPKMAEPARVSEQPEVRAAVDYFDDESDEETRFMAPRDEALAAASDLEQPAGSEEEAIDEHSSAPPAELLPALSTDDSAFEVPNFRDGIYRVPAATLATLVGAGLTLLLLGQ